MNGGVEASLPPRVAPLSGFVRLALGRVGTPYVSSPTSISKWAAPNPNSQNCQATAIQFGCWDTRHHGNGSEPLSLSI